MLCLLHRRVLHSILHVYFIASFSHPWKVRLSITRSIQPFLCITAASHKSVRRQWCSRTLPGFPLTPQLFSSGLASSLAVLLTLPLSNKTCKPLSYRKLDSLRLPTPEGFNYHFLWSTSSLLPSMAQFKSSCD